MPTSEELNAAVSQGIIDAGQAEQLTSFFAARAAADPWSSAGGPNAETEDVRFVRGFHDILIAIGITLLFVGLGIAAWSAEIPAAIFVVSAAIAWGLAEYLGRMKRLVLPTIVLAIGFIFFCSVAIVPYLDFNNFRREYTNDGITSILVWGSALAGAVAFYLRFRLPFALGLIAGTATILVIMIFGKIAPGFAQDYKMVLLLLFGIAIFAAAMSFDLSDPQRKTLRADNAFWLHLIAAPLLVRSILSMAVLHNGFSLDLRDAGLVIAIVVVLALVALMVDRRALLIAGLGSLGYAIAVVVAKTSLAGSSASAVTFIILGVGIVTIGTGWQTARSVLLRILPLPSGFANRLPPAAGKS